jgi:hypothetical protein
MARRNGTPHSNGNGHTVAEDIVIIEREIGQLMHDIEARVGKLQALAGRNAKEAADGRMDSSRSRPPTPPTGCEPVPMPFPIKRHG